MTKSSYTTGSQTALWEATQRLSVVARAIGAIMGPKGLTTTTSRTSVIHENEYEETTIHTNEFILQSILWTLCTDGKSSDRFRISYTGMRMNN